MVWQVMWRRRVAAGPWRMGRNWQSRGKRGRRLGMSKEQEASAAVSASELGETDEGKAGSRI